MNMDDVKLSLREVVALLMVAFALFGVWFDLTTAVKDIPRQIRLGDVKVEMATLRMELSYMENRDRDESENRMYQSKTRTLARLEAEWDELQRQ